MKLCMGCMESYDDEYGVCPHCGYVENSEPEEANQLRPGTILHNKYVVGKAIGHGAFGVTYLGYDAELERKVAIKEYMPGEFSNRVPGDDKVIVYEGDKREQFESGLEKFTDEARRLAMFQDKEGIVQIYDCFQENNTAYLVMEYLEGITAKAKIRQGGKMSLEEALGVIMPILRSLKEVNAAGILHRDIAPDNIMLTKDGGAKLIDFGASRFATTGHSRSLTVLIKQGYAPVEQYNGRGDQGTWTDVYGLAATFYFLLTGKTPQDAMERKGNDRLKPPSKEGAEVKKNVDVAIMNAMNLGIEYRTKTMEDFEKELLSIEEVARVVEPDRREDLGKMPKWLKVTLAACAVLIVTFGVLLATGVINFGGVSSGVFELAKGHTYVPTFVNQPHEQAKDIASKNQLKVSIMDSRYSDEIEMDMVLSQSISSGSEVASGSTVELVVSAGRKQAEVPSLLGMNVDEARKILEQAELKAEVREVDNNAVAGSVVSQSLEALSLVDPGTIVVLEYSNGNAGVIDKNIEVTMPNLVKEKFDEAQKKLGELGLLVAQEPQYSNTIKEGCVISQSEPAGTVLHQGDTVKLFVSLGKQKVNMPYVAFKSEEEARNTLDALGLKVNITQEYRSDVPKGFVASQSIQKDTQIEVGTTVTLVVSLGEQEIQQAASTPASIPESTPEPQWSEWFDSLPAGVTSAGYYVEEKTQYSYRDKSTLTSTDSTLANQGYTLEATNQSGYTEWGAWSGWSETAQTGTDLLQVESRSEYRYRDRIASQNSWWTDWSTWQDAAVGGSSTREVRTQEVDDPNNPIYKTYYQYSRWYFYKRDSGAWTSAPVQTVTRAQYEDTGWLEAPLKQIGNSSYENAPMYDGQWYNETTKQEVVGYNKKTQYSYRDYQTSTSYSWGDWTGWGTTAVSASDDREVNTRTMYRTRPRSVTYTYTYSKWGDWTGFSDSQVGQSGTREVRTKILYRYKKK